MKKVQFTQEGLDKLKVELGQLKGSSREKAVVRLQTARSMGDLSENSEYAAAKEDLAFIEGRIRELETLLKNAEVIKNGHSNGGQIGIGDKVTVESQKVKNEYHIVGEFEANPLEKKLSITSPIGKSLLGRRVGEHIEVNVPAGRITYTIVDIQHP